jgi:TPR repeat protein
MRLELPGFAEDRAKRRARFAERLVAASSGDVDAQLALAWEYARGDAVDADMAAAGVWFERAAASGQEEALVHRARFLQLRSVPEGVRELRRLARQRNWKAQFWLGRHYQSQTGRWSQLRAAVWFDRSSKNGNPPARLAKLGQLKKIASFPSKVFFAGQCVIEAISMVWRISQYESQIDLYETLVYQLKRRGR